MGILLIGIVAALFFRNEPLLPTDVPAVRREQELNKRLRERDVAVYLNDSRSADAVAIDEQPWTLRDVLRNMDERNKSQPSPVASSRFEARSTLDGRVENSLDGFRRIKDAPDEYFENERPNTDVIPQESVSVVTPLPPLFPATEALPTESLPTTADELAAVALLEFRIPENFDEYIVRYGDTLSGIAHQTLGSQARYREIFEANRDRIASPDRLEFGKPIRIPRMAGEPPRSL